MDTDGMERTAAVSVSRVQNRSRMTTGMAVRTDRMAVRTDRMAIRTDTAVQASAHACGRRAADSMIENVG